MKILFVATLPPQTGGSAEVNVEVLNGLARRGHACRAIAPITAQTDREVEVVGEVTRYLLPEFVPCSYTYFRSRGLQEMERRAICPLFSEAIAKDRPDVIVLGRETFVFAAELAAQLAIPTVMVCHDGGLARSLQDGTFVGGNGNEFVAQLQKTTGLVAVAEHCAHDWRRLGFDNVRAIPNAVDHRVFNPAPKNAALQRSLGIAASDVVVAHVSNLKPIKRLEDLMDSAARALAANPHLLYMIVGEGPMRSEMEQACRRHKMGERFRFTGWVPHRNVVAYLNLADMVVMTSLWEAMSLAMLEAQACAKLVLASDVPGARELIRHGETGLLFSVGDVRDLTDQTLRAAADSELRNAIGRRAYQEAQGRSLHAMVGAYEQALREAIDSAKTARRT